jgi:hypothetical protein
LRNLKANTTTKNGEREGESQTAISRAIDWLQSYVDENPYSVAANEARTIINGLKTVRQRPGLDQVLALIGEIAKTDQGMHEINRAIIRMRQPGKKTDKENIKAKSTIKNRARAGFSATVARISSPTV